MEWKKKVGGGGSKSHLGGGGIHILIWYSAGMSRNSVLCPNSAQFVYCSQYFFLLIHVLCLIVWFCFNFLGGGEGGSYFFLTSVTC